MASHDLARMTHFSSFAFGRELRGLGRLGARRDRRDGRSRTAAIFEQTLTLVAIHGLRISHDELAIIRAGLGLLATRLRSRRTYTHGLGAVPHG